MIPIFVFLALSGILLDTAWGQAERLVLNPPLSQVFPLDPKADGMRLKFPVLLNSRTVLGPEVILRFIYVDPSAGLRIRSSAPGGASGGGGGGGGHGHHGGGSQDGGDASAAYSRSSSDQGAAQGGNAGVLDGIVNPNKDATSEIRKEVWTQPDLFRQALDEAADMGTTLVYSMPGKPKTLSTTIDLPDGMLLADIGNRITVLAMTTESKAYQSGVQSNDEIRSLEGAPAPNSLADFARTYLAVQEEARKAGKSYAVGIWRPSESRLLIIQVAAPPSIPSMF